MKLSKEQIKVLMVYKEHSCLNTLCMNCVFRDGDDIPCGLVEPGPNGQVTMDKVRKKAKQILSEHIFETIN